MFMGGYTYFFEGVIDLEDLVERNNMMLGNMEALVPYRIIREEVISDKEMTRFMFNMNPKKKVPWLKKSDKDFDNVVHVKRPGEQLGYLVVGNGKGVPLLVGMFLD